jgi:hypothetical protein
MDDHPVPALLYHYTDVHGFKGIVESRELWATHIQYLNDTQEYHYAEDLANRVINEWYRASAEPAEHAILSRLRFYPVLSMKVRLYVCMASFSEVGDALSQWRGYCPNGAGYSLGFVTQDLLGEAAKQGFSLARCLYDEESQREAITQALEAMRQLALWIRALERPGDRLMYRRLMRAWWDMFAPLAPTIKHQAFRDEQEWRLISAPVPFEDARWRVRAGRSMLIPYLPITLALSSAALPIQDLVVGPTPHMELAMMAAGVLLGPKLEPGPISAPMPRQPAEIRSSRVPYRQGT